jgi:hypothetical protein
VEELHETVWLLEGERPQQYGVDDAEDRRVDTYPQGQDRHDGEGKRGGSEQGPYAVVQIGEERIHD